MNQSRTVPVDCRKCRLADTRTNIVAGSGSHSSAIAFIGEAPGKHEDQNGEPFIGSAGRILDKALGDLGLARDEVFVTNIVKCRPPGNRRPRRDEIAACTNHLRAEIDEVEPEAVCVLGQTAAREILGHKGRISEIVGKESNAIVGGRRLKCVVAYHPAACLYRRENYESFKNAVEKSLKAAGMI
ncbi:MAG: uracil-DNA glycosylase [Methanobacteriota archaeon]|nr:MAG: uracil-DNA glycosylase [Euryarchaeota archaeon]